MKIAITGGTGFVGRHLARALAAEGHQVVLISRGLDTRDESVRTTPNTTFAAAATSDDQALALAFAGCDAVVHCAGINREIGKQTFARVHIQGTRNVVAAARVAGVRRIVILSFLRARPNCGSPYHESKWAAEEIVRTSGIDQTIVKSGMTYGRGDHMLDHLSHAFHTLPVFALLWRDQPVAPLAVDDLVRVLRAAVMDERLVDQTVAVVGPETITLAEAVRRVARVVGRRPLMFRLPTWAHMALATAFEAVMVIPLVVRAQVRILAENGVEPLPAARTLPADLRPRLPFSDDQIRRGLPEPGRFGSADLRCCATNGSERV